MVIRTEYHGQRYSMGSSDPLPAGFKIRFGSLNFQATGNGYLMRITNREELRARRQIGPTLAPVAPTAGGPPARKLRAPQRLDADDAPNNTLDKCGRNADRLRAPHRNIARPPARRQPPRRGSTQSRDHGSPSACAAPRRHTSPLPAPAQQRAGYPLPATPRRPEIPAPPPTTSHLVAPLTSSRPLPHTGTRSGTSPACRTQ
jgi:hypothetical protein